MPLSIDLITIGDELLSGRTLDANGPYLAKFAQSLGTPLVRQQVIGDQVEEIKAALVSAAKKSAIVICSGGLGPTPDDRTKNALSSLIQAPLEESPQARELLELHYQRIGKEWSEELNSYHLIPKGVTPLLNPKGLAPGFWLKFEGAQLLFLAGPPREFKAMLEHHLPEVIAKSEQAPHKREQFTIRTYGVPEEKIFGELCPKLWQELETFGKLSSLPTSFGVDLVVQSADPKSKNQILQWQDSLKAHLSKTQLAAHIWQYGEESLASFLLKRLREKKLTLALAESCTGGLASSMITDISGCSDVFMGSIISYANQVKKEQLNVADETLQHHGAVSLECVKEMAEGAKEKLKTDIAIAYSGVAGPTGGSDQKPVGTLSLAIAGPWGETETGIFSFKGDRITLKNRFAVKGFQALLLKLNQMNR